VDGPEALFVDRQLKQVHSSNGTSLPYFCSISVRRLGGRLYPKLRKASANSSPSIDPDRSLSKCRKTPCQSLMYFHNPANSVDNT
jgi:hypothetical protein